MIVSKATPAATALPPGYSSPELIFEGNQTLIYRACRDTDGLRVVIKVLAEDQLSREAVARFHNEYEISRHIPARHTIKVLAFTHLRSSPAIVMEDIGGESLQRGTADTPLPLPTLLQVAVQLSRALDELHSANIVHCDINPANVVYNCATGVIKVIDFGLARYLSREHGAQAVGTGQGTLPYMSPEQTGRVNRPLDYRTDFYSLGATLYELLTRRRLFDANTPAEWFHGHVARQPVAPADIDPSIPRVVSDIVLKLLAKTAEDRYQSARGLGADFQACVDSLTATAAPATVEPFVLGRHDVPANLQFPPVLYGREPEIARLCDAFENCRTAQAPRSAWVSGNTGVGKTSAVLSMLRSVVASGGHFATSAAEQAQQGIPYSALAAALRDLLRQLLTHDSAELELWKQRFSQAGEGHLSLLLEFLPELQMIVGPQAPVEALPPLESERRFKAALLGFVNQFSADGTPLVLFLDDFHWADSSSVRFVEHLLARPVGSLLVVAGCRDDELAANTVAAQMLERLSHGEAPATRVKLLPLSEAMTVEFLLGVLRAPRADVAALADVVHRKTEGNPFFIREFLRSIHRNGRLAFDTTEARWAWTLNEVQNEAIAENLAGLTLAKLQRLPPDALHLLKLASCGGNRVSFQIVAALACSDNRTIVRGLHEAVHQGLLLPMREQRAEAAVLPGDATQPKATVLFAFAHERLREAAYGLLDEPQKLRAHLEIGRHLLAHLTPEGRDEQLFNIARHLNLAAALLDDPEERRNLCELNAHCGRKASRAGSHEAAFHHYKSCVALLDEAAWTYNTTHAVELHVKAAEAAYLTQHYDDLEAILATGLFHARDRLDIAALREVQVVAYIAQGRMGEALDIAKPALALLGARFPAKPRRAHVLLKVAQLRWTMRHTTPEGIRALPPMTDPVRRAALRLSARVSSVAMFVEPMLGPLIALESVMSSLSHGYAKETAASFELAGVTFAAGLSQYERGQWFGRMGLEIAQKLGEAAQGRARHTYASLIQHWTEPLHSTLDNLREAMRLCLEGADFEFAAHASMVGARYALLCGRDLEQLDKQVASDTLLFNSIGHGAMLNHHASTRQVIQNLLGQNDDPAKLSGRVYDIDAMLPAHVKARDNTLLQSVRLNQMFLSYTFNDTPGALALVNVLAIGSNPGFYTGTWAIFMAALIHLRAAASAEPAARAVHLKKASHFEAMVRRLAQSNKASNLHKWELLRAERLRVNGQHHAANDAYDTAIDLAREHGWLHEQALGNELCGAMHAELGRSTLARAYLSEASQLYGRWGATAKTRELRQRFPRWCEAEPGSAHAVTTSTSSLGNIDLGALTQSLAVIAGEQVCSRMLGAVVMAALELAGAQRGLLILRNSKGAFCVDAETAVDQSPKLLQSMPLAQCKSLSQSVVNYVARTSQGVVIDDAPIPGSKVPGLHLEPYVLAQRVRSVLCLPIIGGTELIGMLYLENNQLAGCFTRDRLNTLEIICLAAAGRIELSRKAAVDGLTQLYNHDYFQNMLRQEMAGAVRHDRPLSMILCDIDHFKRVNDGWGHQVGDQVLREVAELLRQNAREGDVVARYGGEEMAIILPSTAHTEALLVAERLRAGIAAHTVLSNGKPLNITASFGVSTLGPHIADAAELVRAADAALYQSKGAGRNCVTSG